MRLTLCCVGRLKEKYWQDAVLEYSKRISRYSKLTIIEVPDEKAPENMSELQGLAVMQKEGERLLKAIPEEAYVVALVVLGKKLTSEAFAKKIADLEVRGVSHMAFVIGGSLGLWEGIIKRADFLLSFSDMTFPHQMMRVVLLEQVYRSMKIIKGEPYHK